MSIEFSRELIKGRIAEVIFEQMIREEGKYTTVSFGYEHTIPTLAQYQHLTQIRRVMENIKDAPDFALISEDKIKVFLIEVIYRKDLNIVEIKKCAEKLLKRWNPSWLFVATSKGFHCAPCSSISRDGKISRLSENWVPRGRQEDYLKLLNEFNTTQH